MTRPAPTALRPRAAEIVTAARTMLEERGFDDVTMRALAEQMGIRAPSLYKHMASKAALKFALIEQGLIELGGDLHVATGQPKPIPAVLNAYRKYALSNPNLYRLGTSGPIPRGELAPGLEEWTGAPFYLVTGDEYLGEALWSFAHGTVILELDGRFWNASDLDRTWEAGAAAFSAASAQNQSAAGSRGH